MSRSVRPLGPKRTLAAWSGRLALVALGTGVALLLVEGVLQLGSLFVSGRDPSCRAISRDSPSCTGRRG